ncbi:homocysteine S-methyltransferase family protein [Jannaschia sp.]|nr:homocysteine S-methyltransferase family protein [Jannaschia sp.]
MTALPHEGDGPWLTWTGLETDLIFNRGVELPGFASFPLLAEAETRALLIEAAQAQIAVARASGMGTILEASTWMANPDRAAPLGYAPEALDAINRDAIAALSGLRARDVLISGNVGPRCDPYRGVEEAAPEDAQAYHSPQLAALAAAGADLVTAYTLGDVGEAVGIARAAQAVGLSLVISFTVETDGRLISGETLDQAIGRVDVASGGSVAYFMVNCAHPDHIGPALTGNARLRGLVVNASRCSHAELDASETLDDGDPVALGAEVAALLRANPALRVFGGCCGTDMRHLKAMMEALT